MAFGLDYISGPPPADMKAANVSFVCRYLSEVNDLTKVKLLSLDEAKMLGAAGFWIVSNYEWYANRAAEGYDSGVYDAQIAASQHTACGGPDHRPIYFSVDYDTVATDAIIAYFRGVASVIGLERTGAYGSYAVIKGLLDAGVITWAWQTYAWSNGQWDARAHIRQYNNGVMFGGVEVDYDQSMTADFGQWIPGGGTMQQYTANSADFSHWFTEVDADHWKCIQTGKEVQYGIKGFYTSLSMDGNTLPIAGLPITNEIYLTLINGKQVVLQVFERFGVYYDLAHVKDHQPGTGDCSICHITDTDFLSHIPGLPTQQPPNIAALVTSINAIADGVAPLIANALIEAKKL